MKRRSKSSGSTFIKRHNMVLQDTVSHECHNVELLYTKNDDIVMMKIPIPTFALLEDGTESITFDGDTATISYSTQ